MSFSGPSQHRCKCFGEGDGPNGTYYPCPPELCEAEALLARAEAAEAELQRLRGGISVRDALVTENAIRAAAAEAEAQRYREGLRAWLDDVDDALSDDPDGHDAAIRIGARWDDHDAELRALLSEKPDGGGAK